MTDRNLDYINSVNIQERIIKTLRNNQQDFQVNHQEYRVLDEWVHKTLPMEQNKPLIISNFQGSGRTSQIQKWIEYHQKNSTKKMNDIILPYFVRQMPNSDYHNAMYKILQQLREILKINHKVELSDEKIRKYFFYWLDTCNQKIASEIIDDRNIIIILDGIDQFQEKVNQTNTLSFWLPKIFPPKIKFLITCEPNSSALEYFKNQNCQIFSFSKQQFKFTWEPQDFQNKMLQQHQDKLRDIFQQYSVDLKTDYLFCHNFINFFIPDPNVFSQKEIENIISNLDFQYIQEIQNQEQLIEYGIKNYGSKIFNNAQFIKLFNITIVSYKGFIESELLDMSGISQETFNQIRSLFKYFLTSFDGLYFIINNQFKAIFYKQFGITNNQVLDLHILISDYIDKKSLTLRLLEEISYHYEQSNQFLKLKDGVSNIEQFLMIYNNTTKFELCRYWQKLEEKGFDPSIELNKSLEIFDINYHPEPHEIFHIIVQISKFLKEFSDFENCPVFRHPKIKGPSQMLNDIGLLDEIKTLGLLQTSTKAVILNDLEKINTDIPANREVVFEHYKQIMHINLAEQNLKSSNFNDQDMEDAIENFNYQQFKQNQSNIGKDQQVQLNQINEADLTKNDRFYYYKRWIWIIFPWACLSNKSNTCYSKQISIVFNMNHANINENDEKVLQFNALIVTLEQKIQNQKSYAKQEDLNNWETQLNNIKYDLSKIIEEKQIAQKETQFNFKNFIQTKISVITSVTNKGIKDPSFLKKLQKAQELMQNQSMMNENSIQETNQSLSKLNRTSQIFQNISMNKKSFYYQPQQWFRNVKSQDKDIVESLRLLPKLNQSIANHSYLEIMESEKQEKKMIQMIDGITYKNNHLKEKLKLMNKKNETNSESVEAKDQTMNDQKLYQKLKDLTKKAEKYQQQFNLTVQLKQRYKIIIELCKSNRLQNEETMTQLNFLLSNYNNMIDYLIQKIHKQKDESKVLTKLNSNLKLQQQEQKNNHVEMQNQIKNNLQMKKLFDLKVKENDKNLENSLGEISMFKINKQPDNKDQSKNETQIQVKKNYKNQFREKIALFNKIKHLFNYDEEITLNDQTIEFNNTFKQFLYNKSNCENLKTQIYQRKQEVEDLTKQIDQMKKSQITQDENRNYKQSVAQDTQDEHQIEIREIKSRKHLQNKYDEIQSKGQKLIETNKFQKYISSIFISYFNVMYKQSSLPILNDLTNNQLSEFQKSLKQQKRISTKGSIDMSVNFEDIINN